MWDIACNFAEAVPLKRKATPMRKYLLIFIFTSFATALQAQVAYTDHWQAKHYTQRAANKLDSAEYETAINYAIKALEYDSTTHSAYLHLAHACTQTEQFEIMEKHLAEGVSIFPDDDELWYHLGNAHQKQSHFEPAIKAYGKAADLSKTNGEDFALVASYYFNRGNCAIKLNRSKAAIADYTEAINRDPENGAYYLNRGVANIMGKNKSAACADWRRAVNLGQSAGQQYLTKYCR